MRLNSRIRKRLAGDIRPDEQIVATVLLDNQIGTGSASSDGTARQSASSALGTAYTRQLGLDEASRTRKCPRDALPSPALPGSGF